MAKIDALVEEDLLAPVLMKKPSRKVERVLLFVEKIGKENTRELSRLLDYYGWFKLSEFEPEVAKNAWLLVQHSGDLNFQHKVLFILEKLMKQKEADPGAYAYLYDRVTLSHYEQLGIKQRYGTQFIGKKGKLVLAPYEGTLKELEQRRKNFGLENMEHYRKRVASFSDSAAPIQ